MDLLAKVFGKFRHTARLFWRLHKAKRDGVVFLKPNYIFRDTFDASSLLIDIGCGHEAEFSIHVLNTYGSRVVGVDPTRKHAAYLRAFEKEYKGRFRYVSCAVSGSNGVVTFHESAENESGSLMESHTNVIQDELNSYQVETVTLSRLLKKIGADEADFLKLDLEGAEYDLLNSVNSDDLAPFKQIFVEFHHHCIADRSREDTEAIAASLCSMGLKSVTLDEHNFLFYWPSEDGSRRESGQKTDS